MTVEGGRRGAPDVPGPEWPDARRAEGLADDELRCIRFALEATPVRLEGLRALLTADERQRADRFVMPRHRRRFVAARGFLRELLGALTGIEPAALCFDYGEHGKPRLAHPEASAPAFNLSHSGELALAAVASGGEVGVDLEQLRDRVHLEAIARRFFSAREAEELLERPEPERRLAFFRCWTRKEAFVKAKGGGLSLPLDGFRVTLGADAEAALAEVAWDPGEVDRWQLQALAPGNGFVGAVVSSRPPFRRLTRYHWA